MGRKRGNKVFLGVKIDPRINEIMRDILPAKQGAISGFVEEAIREKLERDYGVIVNDQQPCSKVL